MCVFYSVDSSFPGVVFWDYPIQRSITSVGAIIESPDAGISLSIPEGTLSPEEDGDFLIHPCFNGPFQFPTGYESVSPTYLLQPSRAVKAQRDVTLRIHHYASLQSEEDCEEMAFFSASATPQYRRQIDPESYQQSASVSYIFKEMKPSKVVSFKPKDRVGEIAIRHFCFVTICRRNRLPHHSGTILIHIPAILWFYNVSLYSLLSSTVSYPFIASHHSGVLYVSCPATIY